MQQARNLAWQLDEEGIELRILLHDRDRKYAAGFNQVFEPGGARVVSTPLMAPTTNAHAERWIGSCRRECLDWTLIVSEAHLRRVLREYLSHYNHERPHRSRHLRRPSSRGWPVARRRGTPLIGGSDLAVYSPSTTLSLRQPGGISAPHTNVAAPSSGRPDHPPARPGRAAPRVFPCSLMHDGFCRPTAGPGDCRRPGAAGSPTSTHRCSTISVSEGRDRHLSLRPLKMQEPAPAARALFHQPGDATLRGAVRLVRPHSAISMRRSKRKGSDGIRHG